MLGFVTFRVTQSPVRLTKDIYYTLYCGNVFRPNSVIFGPLI